MFPNPKYQKIYGCSECRGVCHYINPAQHDVPHPLRSMESLPGIQGPLKAWTRQFYFCEACESIWAVSNNPKDITYDQTQTPPGMLRALSPDANLDDIMEPLFAWAPVDEITERALWELSYEPQALFDRLVDAWRSPDIDVARQSDILRQLSRLLTGCHPQHAELHKSRGWLIEDFRGFSQELATLEHEMQKPESLWAAGHHALSRAANSAIATATRCHPPDHSADRRHSV